MARLRSSDSATILDIARELGISAMTVSRALRGRPEVHAKTRERIRQVAERLGYRPHRWARSLVSRRSWIIGVVIPDISHGYFAEITGGVEPVIEAGGYDLLLCHSRRDPERERKEMNMLLESRVDGLIVASEQAGPEFFRALLARRTPLVLVDRFFSGLRVPSARVDDVAAGRLATQHLLQLGHRRIAHLHGPALSPSELRLRGYRQAMRQRRIPIPPAWIVGGAYDIASGAQAMRQLLQLRPRPTAVFASNDPMAFGAVQACVAARVKVPEDISIIGAGNIEGDHHPNPFLTTINWPRQELGQKAAQLLLKLIAQPERALPDVVYPPALLRRQSTAAPPLK